MITNMEVYDVTVAPKPQYTPVKVPAKGFYVQLNYTYGDADGFNEQTVGPFTEEQKSLLIELLNLLGRMRERYERTGKGGYESYEDVPGYNDWFEAEDDDVRSDFGLETEYVPDGTGCIASFTGYEVYWQDGITLGKWDVVLKTRSCYKACDIQWDTDGDQELFNSLPQSVDIPENMTDADEISDYLSNLTGFCHKGFRLEIK